MTVLFYDRACSYDLFCNLCNKENISCLNIASRNIFKIRIACVVYVTEMVFKACKLVKSRNSMGRDCRSVNRKPAIASASFHWRHSIT
jgi:hypothetical protein